jgi:hypothetical protein
LDPPTLLKPPAGGKLGAGRTISQLPAVEIHLDFTIMQVAADQLL